MSGIDIIARLSNKQSAGTGLVIGIDATNLRQGGGRTHLIELLRAADPCAHGIQRIVLWGGRETLAAVNDRNWLEKYAPPDVDANLLRRTLWQHYSLSSVARSAGCDLLFVPGGSYAGDFHPVVTMSRNMLPFEMRELLRYGWSKKMVRLLLLRFAQAQTFRSADGVIFLTRYAQQAVLMKIGSLRGDVTVVPHGVNTRFFIAPRSQRPISDYSADRNYRILYVSIVDQYKHQWHVAEAIAQLRQQTQWPLSLDLVGLAHPPALKRLDACLRNIDPEGAWVRYHGEVPYADLHQMYAKVDLGVFASSCENMPNILLETMAAGLPVACSNRGPMPEILQDAGVYFDPENVTEIAGALKQMIASPTLRAEKASASYEAAQRYSWDRCAADTFAFLAEIARRHGRQEDVCAAS